MVFRAVVVLGLLGRFFFWFFLELLVISGSWRVESVETMRGKRLSWNLGVATVYVGIATVYVGIATVYVVIEHRDPWFGRVYWAPWSTVYACHDFRTKYLLSK
jgi:hypothetical protein